MAITQQSTHSGQASSEAAASYAFEAERNRLISNIQIEMSQVLSNVNILNRNLETIITIGQEFEQLSQLWKQFHASAFQRAEDERLEREAAWLDDNEEDEEEEEEEEEEEGNEDVERHGAQEIEEQDRAQQQEGLVLGREGGGPEQDGNQVDEYRDGHVGRGEEEL